VNGASARWSGTRAFVRVGAAPGAVLRLRIAAPRPDDKPVPVEGCVAGRCSTVAVSSGWREMNILLPNVDTPDLIVELRAPVFRAPDGRLLGIVLDSVERR
ncbi:MAG TPA: hypothetical protein VFT99_02840, partial [Roseiflexaceae bacterium]|nr:hypothetical protein [Roseiflexaceae bacterium]